MLPVHHFHLAFFGAMVELSADAPASAQPLFAALFDVNGGPVEEPQKPC